jgi:carbamoyltransferase
VAYCLDAAGITLGEVDHLGCYMDPGLRVPARLKYRAKQFFRSPLYSTAYMGYELVHNARYVRDMRSLCGPNTQLHYMEHHPAHAASAFLASPFHSAALLSVDYIGEMASTWVGYGEETSIKEIHSIDYPHSLGVFYSAITDYLGFLRASDEYKVMGLASFGEPEFYEDFKQVILEDGDDWYRMDLSWMAYHYLPGSKRGYFSDKFIKRFGPPRKKGEPVEERHQNIAASAQKILEDRVMRMVEAVKRETGAFGLCIAGGVGLNCSLNGRLLRESPFRQIYIQPAAGDDGIAIGAALQLFNRFAAKDDRRGFIMNDARLGPEYDDAAIVSALKEAGQTYRTPENLEAETAAHIADGKIVGWFQGRMEFGPRALGARSILADPTNPGMQDHLNAVVKHREEFRPFAPSVLQPKAHEYFEGCHRSPFMLYTYPVVKAKRELLPAITHVDGTARV